MSGASGLGSGSDLLYFGKVPSRGDFIRSAHGHEWCTLFDRWGTQALAHLAEDPHWKRRYDEAPSFHFAALNPAADRLLAGHWLPSHDEAGRRFPLVTAACWDGIDAMTLAQWSPLCLVPTWSRLRQVAHVAHAASDLAHAQASLDACVPGALSVLPAQAGFQSFVQARRWGDAQSHWASATSPNSMLGAGMPSARQRLLALGLLLSPALTQGTATWHKWLCLPATPPSWDADFWAVWCLSRVWGFLSSHAHTLTLFRRSVGEHIQWMLGFQGLSASSLHALIEPRQMARHSVTLEQLAWVEGAVDADPALHTLSRALMDPDLPLAQVSRLFDTAFWGA